MLSKTANGEREDEKKKKMVYSSQPKTLRKFETKHKLKRHPFQPLTKNKRNLWEIFFIVLFVNVSKCFSRSVFTVFFSRLRFDAENDGDGMSKAAKKSQQQQKQRFFFSLFLFVWASMLMSRGCCLHSSHFTWRLDFMITFLCEKFTFFSLFVAWNRFKWETSWSSRVASFIQKKKVTLNYEEEEKNLILFIVYFSNWNAFFRLVRERETVRQRMRMRRSRKKSFRLSRVGAKKNIYTERQSSDTINDLQWTTKRTTSTSPSDDYFNEIRREWTNVLQTNGK